MSEKQECKLTWPGREDAWKVAESPPTGKLLPLQDLSVDWAQTNNLFFEGDNIDILKHLQDSYKNAIALIYIDPPYNTGQNFLYSDSLPGDSRAAWLNAMAPRLLLAKRLLATDGVLFISIDDGEMPTLKLLCEEIFGEDQVETMIWQKVGDGDAGAGRMKSTQRFRREHEYILACYRCKENISFQKYMDKPHFLHRYKNEDDDPRGAYKGGNISKTEAASNPQGKNYYTVTAPDGKRSYCRQWHFDRQTFERLQADQRIYWGKSGHGVPQQKIFLDEERPTTPVSVIANQGSATMGNKDLRRLFGEVIFPNSKPVKLLEYLIRLIPYREDMVILDFFAGSASTAHAVMQINAMDNRDMRYIMVQKAETCDPKSSAAKLGLKHIAAIGRERIVRASEAIRKECGDRGHSVDMGFRYYRYID